MKTHPVEHIPAYVLGALDDNDARRVAAHVLVCPTCREEVEAFRASVGMAPGTKPPPAPPQHIKQQLMARVHINQAPHRYAVPASMHGGRWGALMSVCCLMLALVFGAMVVDARRQLATTQDALQALQQAQNSQQQQAIATFLSDPATTSRALQAVQAGAHGNMYMQVGHTRAVLLVGGLPELAPGTTYQFWFADGTEHVPSATFSADAKGRAQLVCDAPHAVNSYAEVMVTIEPAGGSTTPSSTVILAAKLAG